MSPLCGMVVVVVVQSVTAVVLLITTHRFRMCSEHKLCSMCVFVYAF